MAIFDATETAAAVKAGACVIQIGGNLADWVAMADWLTLAGRLAAKAPTVIVPTGGPFAETVREAEDMWRLSPAIARRMMLLGMDSHALLLHGIRADIATAAGSDGAGISTLHIDFGRASELPESGDHGVTRGRLQEKRV